MTKVKELVSVVEEKNANVSFITKKATENLIKGYASFKGSAKDMLNKGMKLGLQLVDVKKQFILKSDKSEQYASTLFGRFITNEIGISKTHRNLLMQIVSFDGIFKAVESGEIESISDAKKFMSPSTDSPENGAESSGNESSTEGKSIDKVLSLLKQLDKLGINDKLIEKHIIDNASKKLGIEIKREVEKSAKAA